MCLVLMHISTKGEIKHIKPLGHPDLFFLLTVLRRYLFCRSFFVLYISCLPLLYCLVCSLQPVITCLERADLFLALLCVAVSCVFLSIFQVMFKVRYGT